MKKRIVAITVAILIIIIPFLTITLVGFCLPAQFSETYYGELAVIFDKLKNTKGKKMIFVGNSAVAFGVNTDLLQNEFPDYAVVNFGLYGALGTKFMLDMSKKNISDGDIIVVMPEPFDQTSSLYFSAKDAWRAADGDFSLLFRIAEENRAEMFGEYISYAAEKTKYHKNGEKPAAEGVYSRKAFEDENGVNVGYVTYNRPYNIMAGGYDSTNVPAIDSSVFGEGFIEYLNKYNKYAVKKGATVYYGFCPVNALALGSDAEADGSRLYAYLNQRLDFKVIGHPNKYFLDYRWFYDNNVHMNSAGMNVFSDLLAEDLKLALGINTPNAIPLPEAPEIPPSDVLTGNNEDAALFTYEKVVGATEEYIRLIGLTEEGKSRTSITLPSDYGGVPVREFSADLFCGNTTVSKIVLPENILTIYDNSFEGAVRLSELVFRHDSVLRLNVGVNFLSGADNCYIYVRKGVSTVDCAGGWERYQQRIKFY